MKIAIVGCGFVADFYMQSLKRHPSLELVSVMDIDAQRAAAFAQFHGLKRVARSLDEVLSDSSIGMILNLTNPRSHFQVSKAALGAGKHVYSEKPLAMTMNDARALIDLARSRQLLIASAPGSVLGETAQALWKAVRAKVVGDVRLVYAEIDDGLVHKMPYRKWISASGRPWPYKDEFEVGCTLEHAAYYTTWMTAIFGPALSVTAFSSCRYPDKETDVPLEVESPDFSVACIRFASGVVARLTCSIIAPVDQRFRLFGDNGILQVDHAWDYRAPVRIKRMLNIRRKMIISPWSRNYPLPKHPYSAPAKGNPMDFSRGPAEIASAAEQGRTPALPMDFCLHNNEIVLAIQDSGEQGGTYRMTTSFEPLKPQDWADSP